MNATTQPTNRSIATARSTTGPRDLTSADVWREIAKASFAIVSHVTPSGEPRSSGVVYRADSRRLYVAVAPDSWKARHIASHRRVSVVVPIRRGGMLSLLLPVPPATITFQAEAVIHPAGAMTNLDSLPRALESMVPAERWATASIIELRPEGRFLTYGIGVSLKDMLEPARAQARVPVAENGWA